MSHSIEKLTATKYRVITWITNLYNSLFSACKAHVCFPSVAQLAKECYFLSDISWRSRCWMLASGELCINVSAPPYAMDRILCSCLFLPICSLFRLFPLESIHVCDWTMRKVLYQLHLCLYIIKLPASLLWNQTPWSQSNIVQYATTETTHFWWGVYVYEYVHNSCHNYLHLTYLDSIWALYLCNICIRNSTTVIAH